MPKRENSRTGGELFIVDNSDDEWKALRYLHDWCDYAKSIDVATAYFEIGSLLGLDGQWQKVDGLRVLMGDEVAVRTRAVFERALSGRLERLNDSIEAEKEKDDFLDGVPAIVEAIRSGKIQFRVYRKAKFHAKAYITHARSEVIGAAALVGSSNFTRPGLTQNIELNVQITGSPVTVLQEWYEEHWAEAEDVTLDMLRVIERHIQSFTPFEVWAQSLNEYFKRRQISAGDWERTQSKIWPMLDGYQREGYGQLLKIAGEYNGAFLCDGVGLGKTFIGLMVLERLAVHEGKKVALIVPKSGRESVWEANLKKHLPDLAKGGQWSNLLVLNHTDLNRAAMDGTLDAIASQCDAIVIDEAHNFRNPGLLGTGRKRESRYRVLQRISRGKELYLLTATPVNNGVYDLMHLIELFAQQGDAFASLGVHSLRGHFRTLEKTIRNANRADPDALPEDDVDQNVEVGLAREAFAADPLVSHLVVQRSRAYVKASQQLESKGAAIFPVRENPKVANYDLTPLQQRLLDLVEESFRHKNELFRLALYDPTEWLIDKSEEDELAIGRRAQVVRLIRIGFLKRLESSTAAFELSCHRLLVKLLAFWTAHAETEAELADLKVWQDRHAKEVEQVRAGLARHAGEDDDEDDADPLITGDVLDQVEKLPRAKYKIAELIAQTREDLAQLVKFLDVLKGFDASQDGKLKALCRMLTEDPVLSQHKVLIFTEYQGTARYLKRELIQAGLEGVEEIDSGSHKGRDREGVIRRFAPYYNGGSSPELAKAGKSEIRILIATDVLSEGLNLQDATRLINYDLHWNPVRLMQRIGRVDRRMSEAVEKAMVADHPAMAELRGKVAYWNFLPNKALDLLLGLYNRVAHKTLRISRLFGIEGRRLLTEADDYEDLKDLNREIDSEPTAEERLRQELRQLLSGHPDLEARLADLPNRVFSGRAAPTTQGVFFCYALPGRGRTAEGDETWDLDEARQVRWYFHGLDGGPVLEGAPAIAAHIRSAPDTVRRIQLDRARLIAARAAIEKHIEGGYMRQAQAPVGARPILKAWMELN
ncbi:helicase-related protein [Phenylobacterium kunshanense]|uniref:Helicase n=1 Tax=Phenylobacterium kunshanense TaxID=1445034 RepID=A0A328B7D4_9CAUL|nr:helicase-related protein [Phenylobacterium kunshanense]RAK63320.1 helicase [Phenylobacterium kunshanense]